ncbi:MAG: DUF6457 domain-containing protein [Actinomycetes bacterium]|jgi:hypothetical protein|nr:DUF6457 domain-containing protein [Actinomycetes bacterium]
MSQLDDWVAALAAELGVELDVDVRGLLDLARVAAHSVDRPAAPLTTFVVGYAAGRQGDPDAVTQLSERAAALARAWPSGPKGVPGQG